MLPHVCCAVPYYWPSVRRLCNHQSFEARTRTSKPVGRKANYGSRVAVRRERERGRVGGHEPAVPNKPCSNSKSLCFKTPSHTRECKKVAGISESHTVGSAPVIPTGVPTRCFRVRRVRHPSNVAGAPQAPSPAPAGSSFEAPRRVNVKRMIRGRSSLIGFAEISIYRKYFIFDKTKEGSKEGSKQDGGVKKAHLERGQIALMR